MAGGKPKTRNQLRKNDRENKNGGPMGELGNSMYIPKYCWLRFEDNSFGK